MADENTGNKREAKGVGGQEKDKKEIKGGEQGRESVQAAICSLLTKH